MNQKLIIGIGIFLVLIVLVQGVFLFRMSGQVEQLRNFSPIQSSNPEISGQTLTPHRPSSIFSDKWNPFTEIQRMQNEMNKIFGDMRSQIHLNPVFGDLTETFRFSPDIDIKEEKDKIIVTADIPGSDESNINVTVKDNQLTIVASTKKSRENKSDNRLFRSERFIGQFQRNITLPNPVLAEKMKTDYKAGVLTITIPKA